MASAGGSTERGQHADRRLDLRESARRFSKILVRSLVDFARTRGSDPVELYRLGKLGLKSIEFRRSLLDQRRGPKWSEEKELRRMERQVWKVMSRLEKKPRKDSSELTRLWKKLKQTTEARCATTGRLPIGEHEASYRRNIGKMNVQAR